ncbi:MAG TPA: sulfoacetaldehyde dehydrogenase [Advenella kashmirensis]|uniref:Sulfoacetaldehyde dehydrogenase n=1 Tax=Advenella kashmirensis TaxID=310575 RepID=A0A356LIK1_9BURK|nr:sulfoacetaldehyde dehydrogenase [Advenella kashmirensis]
MDTINRSSPEYVTQTVLQLVQRARTAQCLFSTFDQPRIDEAVLAVGWAIMEPERNRQLAEQAVADTGLGNVPDKIRKNHRKTLGLLRDLDGVKSTGIIRHDADSGITEIARAAGVVAAITPSTNPGATPANKIMNAIKCGNAIIVAPSPKGAGTSKLLLQFIHAEFDRIGAPRDLVQMLPEPISKAATAALMQHADLVVATGSQANVRMAHTSGTPAFGVGAGNVTVIVDESADLQSAASLIRQSKTFDNATSCSSENSVIIDASVYDAMLAALAAEGGVMLDDHDKQRLQDLMWHDGKLSAVFSGKDAAQIMQVAQIGDTQTAAAPRFLMVEEAGFGREHPFSGEKLAPVLTVYKASDFAHAKRIASSIYGYMGAGHSVGLHTTRTERALDLGMTLPASRVIVNQAHCFATGGNFDNGLPFSLSMGCGTWGGNSFSDNMNYRHYMNITRVVQTIAAREPQADTIFADYLEKFHHA